MKLSIKELGNIKVHYLHTNKFKTLLVSCKFINHFAVDSINARSLLPELLTGATKNYPDRTLIQKRMDGLYGTEISTFMRKIGMESVISFDMTSVSEKYLPGHPQVFSEAFSLYKEIMFQPKLIKGHFKKTLFEQERRMLMEELEAEYHDKATYSYSQMKKHMFADEMFQYSSRGILDTLPSLSMEDMLDCYRKMLSDDMVELFVAGDFDEEVLDRLIMDHFSFPGNQFSASWLDLETKPIKAVERFVEEGDVNQSRILIGFRSDVRSTSTLYYPMLVYNTILGDSDQAKLFLSIRERQQLSYDISTSYMPNKGVLFVLAGVENGLEDAAIEKIFAEMNKIDETSISTDDLFLAKETLKHRFLQSGDSLSQIVEHVFYNLRLFGKDIPIESILEELDKITLLDVLEAKQALVADTIYIYKKSGNQL